MNILVVSSYLPYPLFNGGAVRLYNILKELSKHHKITLICEKRPHQTEGDVKEVKKLCDEVITVQRRKQWSVSNVLKTGFSPYPFLMVGHTLPEMKAKIVETLNNKRFDVIHVETFYVYQNLPRTYLPVVLVEHNIEYSVYAKYAREAKWFMKPLLYLDVLKIRYWERKVWQQVTRLVAVSEADKNRMTRSDAVVAANGVDPDIFVFKKKLSEKKEKRILFMGDFTWIQNRQAVDWIITKIWPLVLTNVAKKKLDINPRLWIVGRNIPESIKSQTSTTITLGENEPDTAKVYRNSNILLAPIKIGGGSSYKILEAMCSGVPVVSTPLGAIGVGAKDKKEMLVGETEQELADAVVSLLESEKLYDDIRTHAGKLIEEEFTWETIAKRLERVYSEVSSLI